MITISYVGILETVNKVYVLRDLYQYYTSGCKIQPTGASELMQRMTNYLHKSNKPDAH